jgi:hypothetical protein
VGAMSLIRWIVRKGVLYQSTMTLTLGIPKAERI